MEKKEREDSEKKKKLKEAKEVCSVDWYPHQYCCLVYVITKWALNKSVILRFHP